MSETALLPCLLSTALYWIFFIPVSQPSIAALVLKVTAQS